MTTMNQALRAKKRMQRILRDVSGISGIGITWDEEGQPCIQVNVAVDIEEEDKVKIPPKINRVKVKIQTVNQIKLECLE